MDMEEKQRLILAVPPGSMTAAGRLGLPMAHLCYRVGGGPHLFRSSSPVAPRGGLLVMDAPRFQGGGEVETFCGEVLRECAARKFGGVVCRFDGRVHPQLEEAAGRLGEACAQRGLSCYVSEPYGAAAGRARVLIPTALSGGSLRSRLEEAQGRFGPERVCLWVNRVREDFLLPSPTGSGTPLTGSELEKLREEQERTVFFDHQLCAHYFTYMAGEQGHFVLFDDAGSLGKKLQIGRELGISTAFLPYEETWDILPQLLQQSDPGGQGRRL